MCICRLLSGNVRVHKLIGHHLFGSISNYCIYTLYTHSIYSIYCIVQNYCVFVDVCVHASHLKTLTATTTGTPNRCAISICFLRLLRQPPATRLKFWEEERQSKNSQVRGQECTIVIQLNFKRPIKYTTAGYPPRRPTISHHDKTRTGNCSIRIPPTS